MTRAPVDSEFNVAGVTLRHNDAFWLVRVNRHVSLQGKRWGWIDGADGNVCWSNDSGEAFDERAAREAARIHNDWRDQQGKVSAAGAEEE